MQHVIAGIIAALLFILELSSAIAEDSMLLNIQLCNGADRASPDSQIKGCTSLIDSGAPTSLGLSIVYNNRGNAYTTEAQYDLAIADYDRSLELNPRYVRAYNNRGVVYEKKGDYDRAIENYTAAIELNSQYVSAFVNRAESFKKKRMFEQAARDYSAAIQLQPTLQHGWQERCWVRTQIDELDGALKDCQEAIRLEPNAAAFDSRGLIYLRMGRWDLSIADYNEAVKLNPRLASSLFGRGVAKRNKGNKIAAEEDIAAALRLDKDIVGEFARYGIK